MSISYESTIAGYISETARTIESLHENTNEISAAANMWIETLNAGKKIIFCGNGGSAADAQHLSAELMGRFLIDRNPLAALSLTVDTSALTAIGNDYGYNKVFSRQLRGIGQAGDVLFGMSTSGNSKNILDAFEVSNDLGVKTIALTGKSGGELAKHCDLLIAVPHEKTNHIQEAHITIGHLICAIVEDALCSIKQ